jgi:hypothetical protein
MPPTMRHVNVGGADDDDEDAMVLRRCFLVYYGMMRELQSDG